MTGNPLLLDEEDIDIARQCAVQLARHTTKRPQFRIQHEGEDEECIVLPQLAFRLLVDILQRLGEGDAIAIVPVDSELTTKQAAELLNVSRPHLVKKLLDTGKIPFSKAGTHRRIRLKDLLKYKEERRQAEEDAFAELVAESQALGIGYD